MYGYIYKTTNLINGRLYIGQHRGTFTNSYLGSGHIIKEAIKKYGYKNFKLEVLAFASSQAMLNGLEMKYIFEYRQVFGKEFLYNITNGGTGAGTTHSNEHNQKVSETKKKLYAEGKLKGFFTGKKFSEEHKRKIGLAHKGNKHWLGKNHSEEYKIRMKNYRTGKIMSDVTKEKLRVFQLARQQKIREVNNAIAIV